MSAAAASPRRQWGSGLFLLLMAAGFVAAAWWWTADAYDFAARSLPAEGTVVGVQEQRDRKGRVSTYPIYRFRLAEGKEVQATSSVSVGATARGERVSVRYDPEDPSRVRPASAVGGPGFAPWVLGVFALGFGGWGVALLRRR